MKGVITIEDLAVFYRVGVTDAERTEPQRLLLSIAMEACFREAAETDGLGATIDYSAVSRRLLGYGEGREWRLIETLAVELADFVLREFRPERVQVEVKKFVVPEARHVSVRLTRDREG